MDYEYVATEIAAIADMITAGLSYDEKVKKLMKKYKINSFADLKDDQKDKFYKELDDSHVSEKEKSEGNLNG